MAEPKKKLTRSRRGKRKSHQALKSVGYSLCPKCQAPRLPHHACSKCGFYKDIQVVKK